jgi:hypothetical protein
MTIPFATPLEWFKLFFFDFGLIYLFGIVIALLLILTCLFYIFKSIRSYRHRQR